MRAGTEVTRENIPYRRRAEGPGVTRDGGATGVSPVQPDADARLSTNQRATAKDWNAQRDLMYNHPGVFQLKLFQEALAMRTVLLAVFCICAGLLLAQSGAQHQNAFTPDQIKYGPPPPFVAPGAQLAVLEGDPTATTGDFTIWLKMPDGYKIAPHWHPKRENVTVISGNFKVGMGDQFDEAKMMTFPAGSFAYLDPDMHHYAMASGEVVVQVHGMSPLQFNYVNPADDPSKK